MLTKVWRITIIRMMEKVLKVVIGLGVGLVAFGAAAAAAFYLMVKQLPANMDGLSVLAIGFITAFVVGVGVAGVVFVVVTRWLKKRKLGWNLMTVLAVGGVVVEVLILVYGFYFYPKVLSVTGRAIRAKDPSVCEEVYQTESKRRKEDLEREYLRCFVEVAGVLVDSKECLQVENTEMRDLCYFEVAKARKNPDDCEKISVVADPKCVDYGYGCNSQDKCYSFLASKVNDVGVCEKVKSETNKSECIETRAVANQDKAICWRLSEVELRDECVFHVFKYTKDKSLCGEIVDVEMREKCLQFLDEIK